MPPWLCHHCGHMLDAASSLFHDVAPKEGDVSACINCGSPLILRAGRFAPLTAADWGELEPEVRRELTQTQLMIAHMHATIGRPGEDKGHA
jgi:hypothetical protein